MREICTSGAMRGRARVIARPSYSTAFARFALILRAPPHGDGHRAQLSDAWSRGLEPQRHTNRSELRHAAHLDLAAEIEIARLRQQLIQSDAELLTREWDAG